MDAESAKSFEPTVVLVDANNNPKEIRAEIPGPQMYQRCKDVVVRCSLSPDPAR